MLRPLPLALAVAALLLVAGTAAAADAGPTDPALRVHAEEPTSPLSPGDNHEIPLTVEATCQHAGPADGAYVGDREVHLSAHVPTHDLKVEVHPDTLTLPRNGCQDRTVTAEATLDVWASIDAPAFRVERVQVTAENDDASDETQVTVQPGYLPYMEIDGPNEPVAAEAGSTVQVPLAVANLGNGESEITFEVAEAHDALTVETPSSIVLGPQLGSAEDPLRLVQVPVTVDSDAPTGDALPAELELTPAYALDTSRTGPAFPASFAVIAEEGGATAEAALLPAAGAAILAGGAAVARIRTGA